MLGSMNILFIIAVGCLIFQVKALSSKRAVFKIGKDDSQTLDGQISYIKTNGDVLNVNDTQEESSEFNINNKSRSNENNMYFKIFKSQMDSFFKRYADEMLLARKNVARDFLNSKLTIKNRENHVNNKEVSDNKPGDLGVRAKMIEKETYRNDVLKNKRNTHKYGDYLSKKLLTGLGKYNNEYKGMYDDEIFNDAIENNDRDSNFYLNSGEDNFITEEEEYDNESFEDGGVLGENSENEIKEDDDNGEFLERDEEDRKDKEFGVFDYLVVNDESDESNIVLKTVGKFKYDVDYIPDDYFDNSDYEE